MLSLKRGGWGKTFRPHPPYIPTSRYNFLKVFLGYFYILWLFSFILVIVVLGLSLSGIVVSRDKVSMFKASRLPTFSVGDGDGGTGGLLFLDKIREKGSRYNVVGKKKFVVISEERSHSRAVRSGTRKQLLTPGKLTGGKAEKRRQWKKRAKPKGG